MERKIGDIFHFEGRKLHVIKASDSCTGCFFEDKNCSEIGPCIPIDRRDGKNIIFKDVTNMKEETKEVKITVPEGYEIDKEKSTFDNIISIIFKKIEEKPWRYKKNDITGYWISSDSRIIHLDSPYSNTNYGIFATEKQAKSALAMAQISQIMANDKRFGGVVTDEEWKDICKPKYVIYRYKSNIGCDVDLINYSFLAFHTKEQRDLFLEENEDLVKDYLMIE